MTRGRILVTGAAGAVGREIVPLLREHFALRLLDLRPIRAEADDEVLRQDIRKFEALKKACAGVTAVLHLAAIPRDEDFVSRLLPVNILGTYLVFEAARQAGVRRVIFASSGQTVLGYPPEVWVTPEMPVRPSSVYACTKAFGEALARLYADTFGLPIICLRIGRFKAYEAGAAQPPAEVLQRWCSPRDLTQLIVKAIQSDVSFGIFFAVSNTPARRWDISNAEQLLHYEPVDDPTDLFVGDASSPRGRGAS